MMYDDVIASLLWGTVLLVLTTFFTSFSLVLYRVKSNHRRTRNFLRVILVATVLELFFRVLQVPFLDSPFSEEFLGTLFVGGLLKYAVYLGGLILFYFRVANRVQPSLGLSTTPISLENKLLELKTLKEQGLISEEEYSRTRSTLLS